MRCSMRNDKRLLGTAQNMSTRLERISLSSKARYDGAFPHDRIFKYGNR